MIIYYLCYYIHNVIGCSFAVIPTRSSNLIAVVVLDSRTPNITYLISVDDKHASERFNYSSSCHIASLEVYRGRDQAIGISHSGFSLSDNGAIQVLQNLLLIIYLHHVITTSLDQ